MSTVLNGPWKTRPTTDPPKPRPAHPAAVALLVAAIVGLLGVTAYRLLEVVPGSPVPTERPWTGPTSLEPNGRYFAGEDMGTGVWKSEVTADQVCGYRKVSIGGKVGENRVSKPGPMVFRVDANTQYVDLIGPCRWHWSGQ